MSQSNKGSINGIKQDNQLEFSRSIIDGVEIKRCRNSSHAYKSHIHNELSLGYIVEGSTDLTLNDKTLFYGSGDGVIIPPLMTHQCAPRDISHWAYVMLYVDPKFYDGVVGFSQAKKLTGNQANQLIDFICQLTVETIPDTLENILIDLLLEFGEKDADGATAADTSDIIKSIRDYILDNVYDEITLDQLELEFGLNKFSIIRGFKKLYVTTPASYHLQYRVAEAKRLLGKGADVFDVCEALRFCDQAHLIREFKKMYGVTPATYVAQLEG